MQSVTAFRFPTKSKPSSPTGLSLQPEPLQTSAFSTSVARAGPQARSQASPALHYGPCLPWNHPVQRARTISRHTFLRSAFLLQTPVITATSRAMLLAEERTIKTAITTGPAVVRYGTSADMNGLRACLEDRPGGKAASFTEPLPQPVSKSVRIRGQFSMGSQSDALPAQTWPVWVGWTSRTRTPTSLPPITQTRQIRLIRQAGTMREQMASLQSLRWWA